MKLKPGEAPPPLALVAREKMIQRIRDIHSLGQGQPKPRKAEDKSRMKAEAKKREKRITIHGMVKSSGVLLGLDLLYKARRFASVYTPEQLDALIEQFEKKDATLSWSHIIPLLSLDPTKEKDQRLRETLQTKAAKFRWTSDQIAQEVQVKRKNSRQRNTGRPAAFASDFATLAAKFDDWTRRLTESRPPRNDDGNAAVDLFDRFKTMSVVQLAGKVDDIARAIDAAEELQHAIEKRLVELKRLRAKARRKG